ncbi:hypothetical protein M0L20_18250 [Spirosoma sp. RP8]|uniref:BZIP transcription factor n=1 Tax=Spirosoma liriopis TaxID=2937440 RepID=A0ABT0HNT2_9BACT|nr:hypothetical protein [Spirosoma liriopis]MCK8493814.1 hypothetical protein [Spirosoma liriopis]
MSGGSYNVFVGSRAGYSSVGATGNVFLGNVVGQKNTLGSSNTFVGSPANVTGQYKFLTVDGAGNVILGSINSSTREAANESLWQRNGNRVESVQGESVVIGKGLSNTPAGYKLFVEEGILMEKVKVAVNSTADWSDKVFESDYQLKSLVEISNYIRVHKHLPGIPSAKEMVKWGNDLHQTDAKLLEKIEELTLYSIQLEKNSQELQENYKKQQAKIDGLEQFVKQLLQKK